MSKPNSFSLSSEISLLVGEGFLRPINSLGEIFLGEEQLAGVEEFFVNMWAAIAESVTNASQSFQHATENTSQALGAGIQQMQRLGLLQQQRQALAMGG